MLSIPVSLTSIDERGQDGRNTAEAEDDTCKAKERKSPERRGSVKVYSSRGDGLGELG